MGQAPPSLSGLDARFYRMAQQVPGFAGVALDSSNRNLTLYLSQPASEGRARAAVEAMLREFLGANPHRFHGSMPDVTVQSVRYDFVDLGEWRDMVASVGDADLTSWGIDEPHNRLRVHVRSQAAVASMTEKLRALGIPGDAFTVDVRGPAVFTGSLVDLYQYPVGGVQIFNPVTGDACSLGFNAYDPQGVPAFITASHCTTTYAGPDGVTFYQPMGSGRALGHEILDPPGLLGDGTNGCMNGWHCRYSDAATIAYEPGQSGRWSYLANTSSGNSTIANQPIIGKEDQQLWGEWVYRIGMTSGKAIGQVIAVGTGVTYSPALVVIEGANEVQVGARPGDSGGPVYMDNPPLVQGIAYIAGIEFAADPNYQVFFYSPLDQIYADLGYITVFGTTVSISGPTFINQPGFYTWNATALGSSGYSYQWQVSYDAVNWQNAGFNSSSLTIEFKTLPGIFQPFYVRVTATGSQGGYGQTNTSDIFVTTLHN